jgi:hypothetical protein
LQNARPPGIVIVRREAACIRDFAQIDLFLRVAAFAVHRSKVRCVHPLRGWGVALGCVFMKRQLAKTGRAPGGLLRPLFGTIPIFFQNNLKRYFATGIKRR